MKVSVISFLVAVAMVPVAPHPNDPFILVKEFGLPGAVATIGMFLLRAWQQQQKENRELQEKLQKDHKEHVDETIKMFVGMLEKKDKEAIERERIAREDRMHEQKLRHDQAEAFMQFLNDAKDEIKNDIIRIVAIARHNRKGHQSDIKHSKPGTGRSEDR